MRDPQCLLPTHSSPVPRGVSAWLRLLVSCCLLACLPSAAGAVAPAAPDAGLTGEPRRLGLEDGLLLVTGGGSGDRRMMAFDPTTGDLVDADFFPPDTIGTTHQVLLHPDETRLLVSDQNGNVVWAYDLAGNRLGVFAPAGGADTGIMQNIRGIAFHPDTGHLLVSVASGGNSRAIAEFDFDGNFLGNFIDNFVGGLVSPWGILVRDHDILVGDINGGGALRAYLHDGTFDQVFVNGVNFPWQLSAAVGGNVLVGNSSGSPGAGALEYEADGTFVDLYDPVGGVRGVYELPNGNLLVTNADGVHEISRDGTLVESKIEGVQARFISFVQVPPAAVELHTSPAALGVCAGEDALFEVGVLALAGFDDPVTLSVTDGLPPGASAGFSVNPVTPAFPAAISALTVSDMAGAPNGSYTLEITGETDGPTFPPTSTTDLVELFLDEAPPASGGLLAPADGAIGQPVRPDFSWEGFGGAAEYRFQLADDPSFSDPIEDEVVAGTSHTLLTTLELDTTYYWRVAGSNGCGEGAFSDTFSFTTTAGEIDVPDGAVSALIDAINVANAGNGAVTINLAPGGTYTLTEVDNDAGCATGQNPFNGANGLPIVTDTVVINGNGATIRRGDAGGTPNFRIFAVDGRDPAAGDLTLHDVTIANGFVTCQEGPLAYGGGLLNVGGALTLTGSVVTGNTVLVTGSRGGGIANRGGTLSLTDTVVSDNAANQGGGIYQLTLDGQPPVATLSHVTVSGNQTLTSATQNGGGIFNSGTMTVTDSAIHDNTSSRGGGISNAGTLTLTGTVVRDNGSTGNAGGISVQGLSQTDQAVVLTLVGSTVSGNTAEQHGGGILSHHSALSEPPDVTLINTTVSVNAAGGAGGGIVIRTGATGGGGTMRLSHVTVSDNTADAIGGIFNALAAERVILTNSIVANSGDTGDANRYVDAGHNIIGDGFGLSAPTSVGGDPGIGPLTDNGGPTPTHALLPGSIALETGDCADGTVTEDQRGVPRPQGAACDIGAFEREPSAGPGLVLTPANVEFGRVAVGETADATVTLTSFGTEDLEIGEILGPEAPFTLVGGTCPTTGGTLPAGATCTLDVRFSPAELGAFDDQIQVDSNAPGPASVDLAGESVADAVIDVDPSKLGTVLEQGDTQQEELGIGNLGTDPLTWAVTDTPEPQGLVVRPAGPGAAPALVGVGRVPDAVSATNAGLATAAEVRPGTTRGSLFPGDGMGTTITHSASDTIQAPNTVACSPDDGFTTRANSFLRTFTLSDFAIVDDFEVTEVAFGIEILNVTAPLTVNLYTLDGELVYDNLTLIGSATQVIEAQTQSIVTVPVSGTASAGSTLVVEIAAPNLGGVGAFFAGSNDLGETAPSYLASGASVCDVPEPTPYGELGFPNVHLVMSVTGRVGELGCDVPQGVDWVDVSPLGGTVGGGEQQVVNVTFDATGLDVGDYEASLCLESNDPERPLIVVPAALTVLEQELPLADISPGAFAFEVPQGGGDGDTLHVGNLGAADLVWSIEEAELIAFTHEGSGSGTLDGNEFGDTDFVVTAIADPDDAVPTPPFATHIPHLSSSIAIDGVGTFDFVTLTMTFAEHLGQFGAPAAGFGPLTDNGPVGIFWGPLDAVFGSWDTTSPIGPISGPGFHIGWGFASMETTGGVLAFDDCFDDCEIPATFTAVDLVCDDVADIAWLSVDPEGDTTAPGTTDAVSVAVDATGLSVDTHEATLCVITNDPTAPVVPIPITLTVFEGGAPELVFEPQSLDFGDVEVGTTSPPQTATLHNTGDAGATGLAFDLADESFDADTTACSDSIPAGESCAISVSFTPTEPGPATAALHVSSGEGAAADLPLSGNGIDGGVTPMALQVDPDMLSSDGNGLFEPGEQVEAAPAWRNDGALPQSLAGTASGFTGPEDASYTIVAPDADYGLVEPGETASCLGTEVCYRLDLSDPAARPATHWEATFDETLDDSDGTTKTWTLHIGESFTDVPATHLFYPAIETLLHSGVTGGCTAGAEAAGLRPGRDPYLTAGTDGRHGGRPLQAGGAAYCPSGANSRAQMPVFVLRALEGADYTPPPCDEGDEPFGDVPFDSPFCPWIQDLANRGIVSGCSDGDYCPGNPVTRAQMSIFLLKTLEGADYVPPECTEQFTDVPCPSLFADWIEDLAARGITGGCTATEYCPGDPVSRAQMAVFVTGTFGLTLYGP